MKAEPSAAAKAASRAGELLDAAPVAADVSAPLVTRWRGREARYSPGAIAAEEVMGKGGVRERVARAQTAAAATLLPTKERAGRAAAAEGVLRNLGQVHGPAAGRRRTRPLPAIPQGEAVSSPRATASSLTIRYMAVRVSLTSSRGSWRWSRASASAPTSRHPWPVR